MFEQIRTLPIDPALLPQWARGMAPYVWVACVVFLAILLVLVVAGVVRVIINMIGRRRYKDKRDFEGSAWDVAGSMINFALILAGIPLVLAVAGIDVEPFFEQYSGGAISAAIILFGAFLVARTLSRTIRRFGVKTHRGAATTNPLFGFVATMLFYIVMAVSLIFALQQIGFNANSLVAVVGAAGLAIALALQDTLKAVAAGVWLATYRPFRIGDYVQIAGEEGEVTEITPFRTTLKTVDNKMVAVPNEQAWGNNITNFTRHPRRRIDMYLDVSYDDDIDTVLELLRETANGHPRALAKDDTWAGVHKFADSSVVYRLRVWVPAPEFVQVRADMHRLVKYAFDKAGITIPYPHQVEVVKTERALAIHAAVMAPSRETDSPETD